MYSRWRYAPFKLFAIRQKREKKKKKTFLARTPDCVLAKTEMGYWDIPEGTACVQKTWISTKLGTALGMVGSAYHLVAVQPESAMAGLQRATNITVTMATMGAVFGMATCLSAQARDAPDDPFNYFIGGCASGIFIGARTHSAATGTSACLGLGVLAFYTKVGKMEGWKLAGAPVR